MHVFVGLSVVVGTDVVGRKEVVGSGEGRDVGSGVGLHVYDRGIASQHGVPNKELPSVTEYPATLESAWTSVGTSEQNRFVISSK